MLYFVHNEI
jgi:hypothetical protein